MNRSELLFLYDIENNNPNGDPLDSNKPRIDEATGYNLVTDVRLKRTIRDYLMNYKGYNGEKDKDIFVRTIADDKGFIQDGKGRAANFKNDEKAILKKCIDIRLFGGVIPLDNDSITHTGPVQFKMGRSLHRVEMAYIKGTGAFASKKEAKQQTFREEYILPYSLICFYGIINENTAKHTGLTDADIVLMLEAMWEGTKALNTRTKTGQQPQLLLKINYKEPNFHIGEIDKYMALDKTVDDLKLRNIEEATIRLDRLQEVCAKYGEKIENIEYRCGERIKLSGKIEELFTNMQPLQW